MTEISVQVNDIEATRALLAACLNYFQAMDLAESQRKLTAYTESPISQEADRMKTRFDGYMSDFLLSRYETEYEAGDVGEELDFETLPDNPLGTFVAPRQVGRPVVSED